MNSQNNENLDDNKEPMKLSSVISSVFAAGIGVQSSKNRERDFKQGRFGIFVAAGVIFTAAFIGILVLVVQMVAHGAG